MFRSKARSNMKKGIDADESRRKRADITVELRKKSREEQVMKRRVMKEEVNENQNSSNIQANSVSSGKLTESDVESRLANLGQLVQALNGADETSQLQAVTEFRKLLSIEKNPPIQKVIDTGVVPRLVQMLTFVHNSTLQFEAAWTLTNIASGTSEHTEVVIKHGAIPMFIELLRSPNADVQEQAVWALGNIAGDSAKFRDLVLNAGGVHPLLSVFTDAAKISLIRNATWTLSNLCRGKPQPNFDQIRDVIPMVHKLVQHNDTEVLTDSCWALSYVSDDSTSNNKKIQAVIDSGALPRVVQCLSHPQTAVKVPALRCIGNIVTGNDSQTQAVLQCNPLPALLGLMSVQKKTIRKEACWAISNITAGNSQQIQMVFNANLIPPLISLLRDSEFDIRKEAAWAISNATSGGNMEQICFLAENNAIQALCELFSCPDSKIVKVALDGIENMLEWGRKAAGSDGANKYAEAVEECAGLDGLEDLQQHENEEIYAKCVTILRTYFDSEEEDAADVPVVDANNNMFAFGMPTASAGGGFNF